MSDPFPKWLSTLAVVLTAGLLLAGCGKKDSPASGPAVLSSTDSILKFIPGDTPYAIVNAEPLDDELIRKLTGENKAILANYELILEDAFREHTESLPEDDPEREEAERMLGVLKRVMRMFSLEGMRDVGFDANESVAFYGHGLLPVIRARLVDAERFEATVADIEAEAKDAFEKAELRGNTYRFTDTDDGKLILGAFGDYVVLTFAPSNFGDEEIALLTGIELPATSLAETGTLRDIAAEFGFTSHYLGFVDMRRIASTFVDDRSGLDSRLLELAEFDTTELSDICREEIRGMAEVAPRAVFGYSKIEEDGIEGSVVLELREDIAAGLTTLQVAVPGLGTDLGGLLNFGFSLDPAALREQYAARLDALESDPFECEHFADLQAGVAQGRAALAQPIPPVAYSFRGIVAVIDNIDSAALAGNQPPTELDATVMIATEDAEQLMMMGTMMTPGLAELGIQPDGKPVAVDVPQAGMLPNVPYAAMTSKLLAISMGEGAEDRIVELMAADMQEPAPFFSIVGDAGRYYEMVGDSLMEDTGDDTMSLETRAALRDSMLSLGDVYDRISFDVRFTNRGVEIGTVMTFED